MKPVLEAEVGFAEEGDIVFRVVYKELDAVIRAAIDGGHSCRTTDLRRMR